MNMETNSVKLLESQIIAAELTVGLVLTTMYAVISKTVFLSKGITPSDGVAFEVTQSLVCVWLASNVKFLLFKSNNKPYSLTAHSVSRLVALLALLLGTRGESRTLGHHTDQLSVLDLGVFSFFMGSSFTLLALDHSYTSGGVKRPSVFTNPQRLCLQVDFCATCIFGLLWLVFPDWLIGIQMQSGSEDNPHLQLTRTFGAMMVGDSVASFSSQRQGGKDEALMFTSKTMGTLVLLLFIIHSQLTVVPWGSAPICLSLLGSSLWVGNSVVGYLSSKHAAGGTADEIYRRAALRNEKRRQVLSR